MLCHYCFIIDELCWIKLFSKCLFGNIVYAKTLNTFYIHASLSNLTLDFPSPHYCAHSLLKAVCVCVCVLIHAVMYTQMYVYFVMWQVFDQIVLIPGAAIAF